MSSSSQLQHLAIICDGNRRWARSKGKPAFFGHREGTKRIPELIDGCIKRSIPYLTFWIFSTENWDRSKKEIDGLFKLFKKSFEDFKKDADKKQVKVRFIGDTTKMPEDIQAIIKEITAQTKNHNKLNVTFALNYGGRDEIIRSMKKYAQAVKSGDEDINKLDQEVFGSYLDTQGLPDPDLVVRTSGEQRLSGFLAWQIAYSELYFPQVHFPEFNEEQLELAIEEFENRQRRFGK